MSKSKKQNWGGPWTEKKLDAFIKYVDAYLTILNKHKAQYGWRTIYFDGFAGSGSRGQDPENELYKQLSITPEEERVYKGAAERVVTLERKFDYYYFIDQKAASLEKLQQKLAPHCQGLQLEYRPGDANELLNELAKAMKSKRYAALVLLDPFGMQINWQSIAQLKDTRTDVWILLPTGVIINRLLDRQGKLQFKNKLTTFLGLSEAEIRTHFYEQKTQQTLFGEDTEVKKLEDPLNRITAIYVEQLKKVWKLVSPPLRLDNTRGMPIFHFVFASNNAAGLSIAKDIIKST